MDMKKIEQNGKVIVVANANNTLLKDEQSWLDFVMGISGEYRSDHIILHKTAISEEFFQLKTGLAGAVLQRFAMYHVKLAIIGDFSGYSSKALCDFIYECNQGGQVFFVGTEEEAVERLTRVE